MQPTHAHDPAIVDGGEDSVEEVVARLRRARAALVDGGELALAVPGAPPRSQLPPPAATRLRALVRALSEIGFAIRCFRAAGDAATTVLARADPYVMRSAETGDEAAILRLFHASFHAGRDLDGWRWRYRESPFGTVPASLAVAPDATIAAHYGAFVMPFRLAGRDLVALHVGDTMTAAEHRDAGRGATALLPRTVRHFFARHRDGRYAFYYGFNTGPIQRFCERFIGGRARPGTGFRILPLDADRRPERDGDRRYRVREVTRFGPALDRLLARAESGYGLMVTRSARYLEWRYGRNPETRYVVLAASHFGRPVGWGVFRRQGAAIVWGDALFVPRHAAAAAAVLRSAAAHPALSGSEPPARFEAWFGPRPAWWHRQLEALGFTMREEPQRLGLAYLADDPAAAAALDSAEHYYAKGDCDLF